MSGAVISISTKCHCAVFSRDPPMLAWRYLSAQVAALAMSWAVRLSVSPASKAFTLLAHVGFEEGLSDEGDDLLPSSPHATACCGAASIEKLSSAIAGF